MNDYTPTTEEVPHKDLYQFDMVGCQTDTTGYYVQRWDSAIHTQKIQLLATNSKEAKQKAVEIFPELKRGWKWDIRITNITDARIAAKEGENK